MDLIDGFVLKAVAWIADIWGGGHRNAEKLLKIQKFNKFLHSI